MTRYHGGKIRIGNHISKEIVKYLSSNKDIEIKGYVEPFCGMCGVYRYMKKYTNYDKYIASDIDIKITTFWKSLQDGWIPPDNIDEDLYNTLKLTKDEKTPLHTFIGHMCAFGGQYFGTYTSNYNIQHSKNKCIKDVETLKDVEFENKDYTEFEHLKNFVIYCDPPYSRNHKFKYPFDNDKFWSWCKEMSKNNIVLVSEQSCPIEHEILLETKHLGARYNKSGPTTTENLYLIK